MITLLEENEIPQDGKKYLLRERYDFCSDGVCQVGKLTEAEKRLMKEKNVIFLTGIAQRADATNGNQRVYPYKVLSREVENYKHLIKQNRALGECVDPETEIMTSEGWKFIKDISENENILTLNIENNSLEYHNINQKIVLPFDGEMYHIKNKSSIDMMLTPNHKILMYDRKGNPFTFFAKDIEEQKDLNHSCFKKGGANWDGNDVNLFYIPNSSFEVDSELWAAFFGIWLAEGCITENAVQITQKKEKEINLIRNLLQKMPIEFSEYTRKTGTVDFYINNKEIVGYLKQFGKSHEKYIPKEIKDWSPRLLNVLVEWLLIGDGRNSEEFHREFYTISKQLAEDVSEIFFKLGTSASITARKQKDRVIKGRVISEENSRLLYIVSEMSSMKPRLDKRFSHIEKVPYKGNVYCVNVQNGTWLMRRNGKIAWTHNCDHPDDVVISLQNASHIVRDIWWEGKDVYVKLQVLSGAPGQQLRSLVEDGVAIGLSSRGLGSVRDIGGKLLVEDDFQLICFDVVSEPSTSGAFMRLMEAKKPLLESVNKLYVDQKSYRVKRALNDILK